MLTQLNEILEKCLGDEMSYCQATCPIHVDMKGAIAFVRDGKYQEALTVIRETLPFPGILGRICTHPCETACRRKDADEAISIMALKRVAADLGRDAPWDLKPGEEKPQKVAIVGGGPAGVMAAYELRRLGYPVTIFEALPALGGMLAAGIPEYRLPRDILRDELGAVERLGIEVRLNTAVGKDVTLQSLEKDYDAVFLATGTPLSRRIEIEGADLKGVLWGMDFLRDVNLGKPVDIKGRVVVIGGGNVAADVALTALRLGAIQVEMVCLESRDEMPAFPWEVEQLLDEGVKLNTCQGPNRILGNGGSVTGIEFQKCTAVFDKEGKFNPCFDASCLSTLPADMVILAIGQAPDTSFLPRNSAVKRSVSGYIGADVVTLATGAAGIFAGGDVVSGPKSVIDALAAGKKAAISIDRYLRGEDLTPGRDGEGSRESRLKVSIENVAKKQRETVPLLPPAARRGNFSEVETGFTGEQARREAERCLSCECKLCVKECEFLRLSCTSPREMAEKFGEGWFRQKPLVPYSCNLCELCKEVCPEHLCTGDICMDARQTLVKEGKGPLPGHQFVRKDQEFAMSDAVTLAEPGGGEWAFFPGCSLPGYDPELVVKAYDYLKEKLPGTGIILRCCGGPTHCLGDHTRFEEMSRQLESVMKSAGATGLIFACADCMRTIKRNIPGIKAKPLYEVMLEKGLPPLARPADGRAFSLHDPCTAREEDRLMEAVRELLRRMGYRVDEMVHSRRNTRCCGAGGMVTYADPGLFMKLSKARAAEARYDIVTYCASCREVLASAGKPGVHILDLIFSPDWEQRLKRPTQTGKVRREKQSELKSLITARR